MDAIGRKVISHEIPDGVSDNPEAEVFFITICCAERGRNQLARPEVWRVIDESLRAREQLGLIRTRLVMVMPDHLHGLFSFPGRSPMGKVIAAFKGWLAKQAGVAWQRGYLEHRLRGWESAAEKGKFVRLNPVRAGLVEKLEDWEFWREGVER